MGNQLDCEPLCSKRDYSKVAVSKINDRKIGNEIDTRGNNTYKYNDDYHDQMKYMSPNRIKIEETLSKGHNFNHVANRKRPTLKARR